MCARSACFINWSKVQVHLLRVLARICGLLAREVGFLYTIFFFVAWYRDP